MVGGTGLGMPGEYLPSASYPPVDPYYVWCSHTERVCMCDNLLQEQHGTITAVFKNQIDWIPLAIGSVRPTQGRTLAVAQVGYHG